MQLIGLTGGIASGKTTVARRLAELGAIHIDADQLAREVVEPGTPALRAIAEAFGPSVINSDGTLDRAALGAIVFADETSRLRLNDITHPAVRSTSSERFAEAARANPNAVVVYDVPLLVEAGNAYPFDLIVVTHADEATRIARLIELRGMHADEATRRIRSQASDAERLAVADVVIDTDGSLQHTLDQVDALWQRLSPTTRETAAPGTGNPQL